MIDTKGKIDKGVIATKGALPAYGKLTLSQAYSLTYSDYLIYFDVQDISSMYQNSNGTVAAAVDSPVGYVTDKSGNGNHATQSTSASRPILKQDANGKYYLYFDGASHCLLVNKTVAINSAKMVTTLAVNIRNMTISLIIEGSTIVYNGFGGLVNGSLGGIESWVTSANDNYMCKYNSNITVPRKTLITSIFNTDAGQIIIRENKTETSLASGPTNGSVVGQQIKTSPYVHIASRTGSSYFAPIDLYHLSVRNTLYADSENLVNFETYIQQQSKFI